MHVPDKVCDDSDMSDYLEIPVTTYISTNAHDDTILNVEDARTFLIAPPSICRCTRPLLRWPALITMERSPQALALQT